MEWEDVATKLLDKKLYLSALELYYELLENNHEINSLRDFFSNPGNFETFYNIPRSSSLQTFDSLDLVSRYSDDDINVADERVTVLEFELRKAQETINALRGTLTTSAAPEHKERSSSQTQQQGPIVPYEKKCLNFLISEYLLANDYKLTAITFSDETADQDFDDWEDVGLNCPRPPSLLGIYRTSDHHQIQNLEDACRTLEEKCSTLSEEMNSSVSQISQLKKLLAEYEENMKSPSSSTNDLVIIKEGRKTKSGSDGNVIVYFDEGTVRTLDERNRRQTSDCSMITQDSNEKERQTDTVSVVGSMNSYSTNDDNVKRQEVELNLADATRESPLNAPTSESGDDAVEEGITSVSEDSETDTGKAGVQRTEESGAANTTTDSEALTTVDNDTENYGDETLMCASPSTDNEKGEAQCDSLTVQLDDVSVVETDGNENKESSDSGKDAKESSDVDVISSEYNTGDDAQQQETPTSEEDSSHPASQNEYSVSPSFGRCLKTLVEGSVKCRLSEEISHMMDEPILVMGRCLPHIMPHVLLSKREELLPVILCLAVQHPDPTERDNLLHLLFNLVKRPDFEQRQIIRAGCEAFASNVDRRRVEEELLPQCWEQISDKYVERRLLVSETCGTLSSHLSHEVCSSLVVSILKQVLDDRDESVRESAVKNLSLVLTRLYNDHKTDDLLHILIKVLQDNSNKVQQTALHVYLPSISIWLLSRETYLPKCYHTLLKHLLSAVQAGTTRHTAIYLQALTISNVFVLANFIGSLQEGQSQDIMSDSSAEETHLHLLDPCVILNLNTKQYAALLSQLNTKTVQGSLPEALQAQFTWFRETAVPCIVDSIIQLKEKSLIAEFTRLLVQMNTVIGRTFVQHVVKPVIKEHVAHASVLPVYCAGVLAVCEEDRAELREFLYGTLNHFASQYLEVEPLTETFAELSQVRAVLHILVDVLNTSLREAANPHIKGIIAKICKGLCDCADPPDIVTYVLPILSHLANDGDVFVQTSTVLAFAIMLQRCSGSVGSIREQLDRFISAAVSADVHVMMCELIESFTVVLPLCNPDIQRDFLIPRLATIGVSNSTITNKTKRRDITERLINAYKAILCSYITPDTLEHYIIPGLQALSGDAQEVIPEKQQTVDLMLREVQSKTAMSKDSRSGNAFGSKVSGFFKKK